MPTASAFPRSVMATTLTADEQLRRLRYGVRRREETEPLARFRNESDAHDYAMRVGVKDGTAPIVVDDGQPYDAAKPETNRRVATRRSGLGRREQDLVGALKRRA